MTASAAGAVTNVPDASVIGFSPTPSTLVGSPPDVRDAAAALHTTPQGLKADGLRWQGIAAVYQQLGSLPTAQGLKADGLRLQGIAEAYKQIQSAATPDVFERYAAAHPFGAGLSTLTPAFVSRPPDVRDAASAARSLQLPSVTSSLVSRPPDVRDAAESAQSVSVSQSTGFDWSDYGIGIGSGLGIAFILAAGLAMGWHRRDRMQTA